MIVAVRDVLMSVFHVCLALMLSACVAGSASAQGITGPNAMQIHRITAQICVALASGNRRGRGGEAGDFDILERIDREGAPQEKPERMSSTPLTIVPVNKDAVQEMAGHWQIYARAVRQISAGDDHPFVLQQMFAQDRQLTLPVLGAGTKSRGASAVSHSSTQDRAPPDIISHLSMLSQKMLKDACMTSAAIDLRVSLAQLDGSIADFLERLHELRQSHDIGVTSGPAPRGLDQHLAHIQTLAEPLVTALSVLEPGRVESLEQLSRLADLSTDLLGALQKTTAFYARKPSS
ncbi:MAG: hypothetical protein ABJL99_06935 [Aliishimia sp.]